MGFCSQGGQGKVRDAEPGGLLKLKQFGETKPPRRPGLAHGFSAVRCRHREMLEEEEAGAGPATLAPGPGVSQEWEHPGVSLEEDVDPGSDPSYPSQAGGKSLIPSSSAAHICVEHP